jgi:hypothetical protein
MPSKRVDERVRELLASGLRTRQRSLVVLVGDRGREQAVTLHALLHRLSLDLPLPSASSTGGGGAPAAPARPRNSVLWCYARDLGFSTHRNKRAVRARAAGRRRRLRALRARLDALASALRLLPAPRHRPRACVRAPHARAAGKAEEAARARAARGGRRHGPV